MTEAMKQSLVTRLRDRHVGSAEFRQVAKRLGLLLAAEISAWVSFREIDVETPLGVQAPGCAVEGRVVLVPILRAGLALLDPFLEFFEDATVAMVGVRRDEETAEASVYYSNIPPLTSKDTVIVLDPMLATGGSGVAALEMLTQCGADPEKTLYACVVSAPEGVAHIARHFPAVRLVAAARDQELNDQKFIVPGLGDFGDRYFGTL